MSLTDVNNRWQYALKTIFFIKDEILPLNDVNALEKLLLIIFLLEDGVTDMTNGEFGQILDKEPETISKAINKLHQQQLISVSGLGNARKIGINDFVKGVLYNYSLSYSFKNYKDKIDNYSKPEKKEIVVTKNEIEGCVKALWGSYKLYAPVCICDALKAVPLKQWIVYLSENTLGKTALIILQHAKAANILADEPDPDKPYFLEEISLMLIKRLDMFKPKAEKVQPKITKEQEVRIKNDRSIEKYIERAFDDKLLDVTDNNRLLQSKSTIDQFVKIDGVFKKQWMGGTPSILNVDLVMLNGTVVKVAIYERQLLVHLNEFLAMEGHYVQVRGKVVYNRHHKMHTVKSHLDYVALRLLSKSPDQSEIGSLDLNDDESPF